MVSDSISGTAKVQGVLKYNNDIREEILRRNYWKDKEYTQYGYGIGTYHDIKDREISPVTKGKTLLEYTYDKESDYSNEIRHKYLSSIVEDDQHRFEVKPYEGDISKWQGSYPEIFTDNNKLGNVADSKFMQLMTLSTYANADRFVEDKYLTPRLASLYGSNPQIEGNNGYFNVFNRVGGVYKHESGRIADIAEADVRIVHNYKAEKDKNNGGQYYLDQNIVNAEKNGVTFYPIGTSSKEGESKAVVDKSTYAEISRLSDNKGIYEPRGIVTNGEGENGFDGVDVSVAHSLNKNTMMHYTYDEGDVATNGNTLETLTLNYNEEYPVNDLYSPRKRVGTNNLLAKTNKLFKQHGASTLISRFHTSEDNGLSNETDTTDTAKDSVFGNSHGRNLLKLDAKAKRSTGELNTNGYENPYCRTWTYHHQYDRINRLIRPFVNEDMYGGLEDIENIQRINSDFRSRIGRNVDNGGRYLAKNTVLNRNGFVNITPTNDSQEQRRIENCMFSLENLAWKDVPKNLGYLSKEQIGPNGGRIMWFPPYDLDFQESVSVDWEQSSFIGRGEKVYTYRNTDRQGTLSFTLLIDHPGIINTLQGKEGMGEEKDLHNDVLRFFAGCQLLDLKKKKEENQDKPIEDIPDDPIPVPPENSVKTIKFYVYYPNNYSGNNTPINKAEWERVGNSDIDSWYKYLLTGVGTSIPPEDISDNFIGYEMKYYGDEEAGEGLGIHSTTPIHANSYKPNSQWEERSETGGTPANANYYYKVDFDLRQILHDEVPEEETNYVDWDSYGLNAHLNEEISKGANYSFAEVIIALLIAKGEYRMEYYEAMREYAEENGARNDKITELVELFNSEIEVKSIIAKGSATNQDAPNSKMLANRRAKTIGFLLKDLLCGEKDIEEYSDKDIEEVSALVNDKSDNTLEAKAQRYAVVEMTLNAPQVIKAEEANNQESAMMGDNVSDIDGDYFIEESVDEDEPTPEPVIDTNKIAVNYSEKLSNNLDVDELDLDTEEALNDIILDCDLELQDILDKTILSDEIDDMVSASMSDYWENYASENEGENRYENEADYFANLKSTDPFVFKNIVDKYKYFTPAFHSMSPEGFNARLTFLQQCTRQGHTIEASSLNGYAKTAGNLAFGRMPVCVLKIGDFINTKIIINSMQIQYGNDGIQWDLNPEGAGVQPMYAKVTLGIVIIGGQSLNGPISRLQNAVSFNYYANTGVYDNRSDRVTIEPTEDGKPVEIGRKYENNGDYTVYKDPNNYARTKETYTHFWTPSPQKLVEEKYDKNNNLLK